MEVEVWDLKNKYSLIPSLGTEKNVHKFDPTIEKW
jgi:hypothetical protein